MRNLVAFLLLITSLYSYGFIPQQSIENEVTKVNITQNRDFLWEYIVKDTGEAFKVQAPSFELDGKSVICSVQNITQVGAPQKLTNEVLEYTFEGELIEMPKVKLLMLF
jgi:hypothetical protein